jgi:histidinol-phosphatase
MPSPELRTALGAARAAAPVILSYYRTALAVRTKEDSSPVTDADVRAEEVIRDILERAFPGYGFYGEETGRHAMEAESIWLVDPIDGTKSFVRDTPYFSTQIALMRAGELVLGVSCAPACDEIAWAETGSGAFLNDRALSVSKVRELKDAYVSTGNLATLAEGPGWARLGALVGSVKRIRGYGDFVHYHLLARGAIDVVIESDLDILDIAALTVLVREAGGTFTDLSGRPVSLDTESVLATNSLLHDHMLSALTR